MKEIDIPATSINVLLNHVFSKIDKSKLGEFPFYTKVNQDLLHRAFFDVLDLNCVTTAYIYAHDEPIALHVDRYKKDSLYNLCVPLMTDDLDQRFIVFDQIFDKSGCVWEFEDGIRKHHQPLTKEDETQSTNDNNHDKTIAYVGQRPCDTSDVLGLSDRPISDELADHLPHNKDFYYGLTGEAWHWKPGKGLIFKSSQIHGTGKQSNFKIGCVLLMNSEDFLKTQ
jgi:hypothetical protein